MIQKYNLYIQFIDKDGSMKISASNKVRYMVC